MKRALFVTGSLLAALAVTGLLVARHVTWALSAPAPHDRKPRHLTVPPTASVTTIAAALHQADLIRDQPTFLLAARYLKLDRKLQAGGYLFTRADGAVPILRKLAAGTVHVRKLTLPEGLTLPEVADRIAAAGLGSAPAFLALATGDRPLEGRPDWAPAGSLEGYLFPETYRVPSGLTEGELLSLFLHRFEQTVVRDMGKDLKAQSLSLPEVVTLASIVEREGKLPSERPLMAAVFLNRLQSGKRLESCATVQYALPQRKARLTYADLKVVSPYNTYLHDGLPPGPISSPGGASIHAVLHPADSTALYFVARSDGSHIFSETLSQHDAAKLALRRASRRTQPKS